MSKPPTPGGPDVLSDVKSGGKVPRGGAREFSDVLGASEAAAVAAAAAAVPALPHGIWSARAVHNFSDLMTFIGTQRTLPGADADWLEMNAHLAMFISGVASSRDPSTLANITAAAMSKTGNSNSPERDWTYHAANAIEGKHLDAKGSNLEQVIMAYAPNEIGDSMLAALRALYVAHSDYKRYSMMQFVATSSRKPLNVLAGIYRTLVEQMIIARTCQRGQAASKRLDFAMRRQRGLLQKLSEGCGGLSLEQDDCPSTRTR